MLTKISFLWNKFEYRVKAFNKMKYDINWGHSLEEEEIARKKDREWTTKVNKYQIEAIAYFGLFIIELNKLIKENNKQFNNFYIKESKVYLRGKEERINRINKMIEFLRHAYCHPEEDSTLRLDPYISKTLNRSTKEQDKSFQRVHFIKEDENGKIKYFVQFGGGKIYFSELKKAIRNMNSILFS